jgi:hypothetical protein
MNSSAPLNTKKEIEIDIRLYKDSPISKLVMFQPINDQARVYLEKHTDGQWLGNALAVEERYSVQLFDRLLEAGFKMDTE